MNISMNIRDFDFLKLSITYFCIYYFLFVKTKNFFLFFLIFYISKIEILFDNYYYKIINIIIIL